MAEGTRKPYPSDLTDNQWNLIEPLIPPKIGKGEDRKVDLREVVNGILYVLRTGCQWDYLPHGLLPKGTTYYYFDKWKKDGTLDRMLSELHQKVRVKDGRQPTPSAASVDSQTIKTTDDLPSRLTGASTPQRQPAPVGRRCFRAEILPAGAIDCNGAEAPNACMADAVNAMF